MLNLLLNKGNAYTKSLLYGFKSSKKYLVWESDDWGALRMRSIGAYKRLQSLGLPLNSDPYSKFDNLERLEDLCKLLEVQERIFKRTGKKAKFTLNFIMSNPDFERIGKSGFAEYWKLPLSRSYETYSDGSNIEDALTYGIQEGFLFPQFHGREHLNVPAWLSGLQKGDSFLLKAFHEHVFAAPSKYPMGYKKNLTSAFGSISPKDSKFYQESIHEGLKQFESYFGYNSLSMIAPSYTWDNRIEKAAATKGIRAFQGITVQKIPIRSNGEMTAAYHYTGQKNTLDQIYLVRNAFFEPSLSPSDRLKTPQKLLRRMQILFSLDMPVIVGSHRLNYIGSLDQANRKKNLKLLETTLQKIIQIWPNIEFISTAELTKLILEKQSSS